MITESHDIDRVDFENGVWIHRVLQRDIPFAPSALDRLVPTHIWNWSATALEECRRISTHRCVDIVEATLRDCEGIAFLLEGTWPLVTSLHTTFHSVIRSHPNQSGDRDWMSSFGLPMLALEKELMTSGDAIRVESEAVIREMESAHDFKFDRSHTEIMPHGISEVERSLGLYGLAAQRHRNAS